jgi:hypothetical protein
VHCDFVALLQLLMSLLAPSSFSPCTPVDCPAASAAAAAAAAAAGHLTSIMRSMAVLQLPLPGRIWLRWQGCIGSQLQRLRSREVADVLTALAVARCDKVDLRWVLLPVDLYCDSTAVVVVDLLLSLLFVLLRVV